MLWRLRLSTSPTTQLYTMTTFTTSLEADFDPLQRAFKRLIKASTDMEPLFRELGEHLTETHEMAWESGKTPEGDTWAPLKPATWKRKRGHKPLFEEGDMLAGLVTNASANQLAFGLSNEKAAWHHFGTKRGLPARGLVGMSEADIAWFGDLMAEELRVTWTG